MRNPTIKRQSSKFCEECFNAGVKEALKVVVEIIDEENGWISSEYKDVKEHLETLRRLVLNLRGGDEIQIELDLKNAPAKWYRNWLARQKAAEVNRNEENEDSN